MKMDIVHHRGTEGTEVEKCLKLGEGKGWRLKGRKCLKCLK